MRTRHLTPKHVWAMHVRLEIAEDQRVLGLFNLVIGRKLCGFSLGKLKTANAYASSHIKPVYWHFPEVNDPRHRPRLSSSIWVAAALL